MKSRSSIEQRGKSILRQSERAIAAHQKWFERQLRREERAAKADLRRAAKIGAATQKEVEKLIQGDRFFSRKATTLLRTHKPAIQAQKEREQRRRKPISQYEKEVRLPVALDRKWRKGLPTDWRSEQNFYTARVNAYKAHRVIDYWYSGEGSEPPDWYQDMDYGEKEAWWRGYHDDE